MMSMTPVSRSGALHSAAQAASLRQPGRALAALALAFALAGCGGEGVDTPAISAVEAGAGSPEVSNGSNFATAAGGQSASGLPSSTAPGAALDTSGWLLQPPFQAAGDEPYWRLEVIDGWFVFRRSGLPEIEAPITQPERNGDAEVFEAAPLTVTLRRSPCSIDDGGASEFTAVVTFDEADYGGCAYGGSVDTGSASTESDRVVRSLQSIDACLSRLAEPAVVTAIYPREGGRTAVGLRTRNGSLFECGAEEGGGIAFLDPIEPGAAAAWMTSRMRFLREGVAPEAVCDDAEIVRSGDDQVGLLLTARCKF